MDLVIAVLVSALLFKIGPIVNLWSAIPTIADWLTIVAAGIAIAGIISVYFSRPRVDLSARSWGSESASIIVRNAGTTEPIREFLAAKGVLDDAGHATTWDGGGEWVPAIGPSQYVALEVMDGSNEALRKREPRSHEFFHYIDGDPGFIMEISWRSPLIPWRRVTRAVVWSREARLRGAEPIVLEGHPARLALGAAKGNQAREG